MDDLTPPPDVDLYTRFMREGKIMSSLAWPRVGTVGEPGRMFEVAHDLARTNVVLCVLGGDALAGAGMKPSEARQLADLLLIAAAEVERGHGRQD